MRIDGLVYLIQIQIQMIQIQMIQIQMILILTSPRTDTLLESADSDLETMRLDKAEKKLFAAKGKTKTSLPSRQYAYEESLLGLRQYANEENLLGSRQYETSLG